MEAILSPLLGQPMQNCGPSSPSYVCLGFPWFVLIVLGRFHVSMERTIIQFVDLMCYVLTEIINPRFHFAFSGMSQEVAQDVFGWNDDCSKYGTVGEEIRLSDGAHEFEDLARYNTMWTWTCRCCVVQKILNVATLLNVFTLNMNVVKCVKFLCVKNAFCICLLKSFRCVQLHQQMAFWFIMPQQILFTTVALKPYVKHNCTCFYKTLVLSKWSFSKEFQRNGATY